jgi:predicted dehydrogenase
MKPVKWGILSTAKIGVEKVIPGMLKSRELQIVAIASRDLKRGEAAAKALGIPKAYGSYEELLADPEIEAIYNPLPNHLHVPLTLEAAKHGKHVLCEKPISLTVAEAKTLLKVPKKILIEEAFMVRHNPQWHEISRLVREGVIGRVQSLHMMFSYHLVDPDNVRNKADIGGGGLMDIGCYPITLARYVFDAEPLRVSGVFDRDPNFGTDRLMSGLADFGQGLAFALEMADQLGALDHFRIEELVARAGGFRKFQQALLHPMPERGVRFAGQLCELANSQERGRLLQRLQLRIQGVKIDVE